MKKLILIVLILNLFILVSCAVDEKGEDLALKTDSQTNNVVESSLNLLNVLDSRYSEIENTKMRVSSPEELDVFLDTYFIFNDPLNDPSLSFTKESFMAPFTSKYFESHMLYLVGFTFTNNFTLFSLDSATLKSNNLTVNLTKYVSEITTYIWLNIYSHILLLEVPFIDNDLSFSIEASYTTFDDIETLLESDNISYKTIINILD
jgi:hypothetical protein